MRGLVCPELKQGNYARRSNLSRGGRSPRAQNTEQGTLYIQMLETTLEIIHVPLFFNLTRDCVLLSGVTTRSEYTPHSELAISCS